MSATCTVNNLKANPFVQTITAKNAIFFVITFRNNDSFKCKSKKSKVFIYMRLSVAPGVFKCDCDVSSSVGDQPKL